MYYVLLYCHEPCKVSHVPNTLYSPNIKIIITGTFRNTSNTLKLYEITLFSTGSLAYYSVYESDVIIMLMTYELQMLNFHHRALKC